MSEASEKEARAVIEIIGGAKVLIPFVIAIMSIAGVWYDSRMEAAEMRKDIFNASAQRAKNEAKIEALSERIAAQEITLTEVKSDLKHIKDDTKETLDLVRTWMRGH